MSGLVSACARSSIERTVRICGSSADKKPLSMATTPVASRAGIGHLERRREQRIGFEWDASVLERVLDAHVRQDRLGIGANALGEDRLRLLFLTGSIEREGQPDDGCNLHGILRLTTGL